MCVVLTNQWYKEMIRQLPLWEVQTNLVLVLKIAVISFGRNDYQRMNIKTIKALRHLNLITIHGKKMESNYSFAIVQE